MTRRLALRAERLTELTHDDLAAVAGASAECTSGVPTFPLYVCFPPPTQATA